MTTSERPSAKPVTPEQAQEASPVIVVVEDGFAGVPAVTTAGFGFDPVPNERG